MALLSSVLQYVPEPYDVLNELMESEIQYLIIDRTPFSDSVDDIITVQHVSASIYPASYPCRIFARKPFIEKLNTHFEVIAQFESADGTAVIGGREFTFGGLILRKL